MHSTLHANRRRNERCGMGLFRYSWDEVDDNWSALPDLNRSPVSDEAFALLRELSRQCLEEIRRGRTATTRQLRSMLAEVRG